jgi:hypothetical protein
MTVVRRMYLVRRLGWKVYGYKGYPPTCFRDMLNTPTDDPRTTPVAAFTDRAAAEARARELERAARRLLSPFWSGNAVRVRTSLTEEEFLARLKALGVPPAPVEQAKQGQPPSRNWWAWWEPHAHDWPDDVFHAVWDLFDKLRFHDVVEVELEG